MSCLKFPTVLITFKTLLQNERIRLDLSSDPVLVRLSPSLVHTITVANWLWLASDDGPEEAVEQQQLQRQVMMAAHCIVCNDTIEDVVIGQVSVV